MWRRRWYCCSKWLSLSYRAYDARSIRRKRKRFDDDGDDVRGLDDLPDIDVVQLDELQAVDRDQWRDDIQLFVQDAAQRRADISVEGDHQWKPSGQRARHGLGDAVGQAFQIVVVGFAAPGQGDRRGMLAFGQVQSDKSVADRLGDGARVWPRGFKAGVDHGQVAQRKHGRIRDVHSI